MTDETATEETKAEWLCPKDGTPMETTGRWKGAWRCPECRGMFLDMDAMRRGRAAGPPPWMPVVMSVVMSLGMTMLVRRLRKRPKT